MINLFFDANVFQQLVSDSGVEQEIVVPYHEPVMTSLEDYCEKVIAERNWEGCRHVNYSLARMYNLYRWVLK